MSEMAHPLRSQLSCQAPSHRGTPVFAGFPHFFIRRGLVVRQQKTQQRCCEFNSTVSRSARSRYAVRKHVSTPILVLKHIR
jgi:hypothetical protein